MHLRKVSMGKRENVRVIAIEIILTRMRSCDRSE